MHKIVEFTLTLMLVLPKARKTERMRIGELAQKAMTLEFATTTT